MNELLALRLSGFPRWRRARYLQLLLPALALLLALLPSAANAADVRPGDVIVVGPNEVVDDDLYAFARVVEVQGTVRGDVVAFASNVAVTGMVTGNLDTAAANVTVSGRVGGDVRAAGANVAIAGPIGGDVLIGAGSAVVGRASTVGRDLLLGTGSAAVDGQIGRRVLAGARDMTISGSVGGNVHAEVGSLRLTDGASVGGDLTYTSDEEASIASGATVRGNVEHRTPARRERPERVVNPVIGWLRTLVGSFALGLVLVLLFPGFSRLSVDTLRGSPWASLGIGAGVLFLVPVAAIILLLLGVLIGGWWLALMLLALYGIAVALGFVVAGLLAGRFTLDLAGRTGIHPLLALLLGLAILLLVGAIPFLGPLVVFVAVLFGLGALVLAAARARSEGRVANESASQRESE